MMQRFALQLAGVVVGLTVVVPAAHATILNLTFEDASGFIDGAFFQQIDPQSTGSGVIDPFVRLSDGSIRGDQVEGYNTDGRQLLFDENNSPTFTHSITLGDIPLVALDTNNDGVFELYREFLLDINQNNCNEHGNPNAPPCTDNILSLDELQIYLNGSDGDLLEPNPADLGTLIYDLDGSEESYIKLNYTLNHGSGSGDMFAYIPDSLFSGSDDQFVYLYSKFGVNFINTDGYEEWAVREGIEPPPCELTNTCEPPPVIPEPTSLFLMGSGMLGALGFGVRRKRA